MLEGFEATENGVWLLCSREAAPWLTPCSPSERLQRSCRGRLLFVASQEWLATLGKESAVSGLSG